MHSVDRQYLWEGHPRNIYLQIIGNKYTATLFSFVGYSPASIIVLAFVDITYVELRWKIVTSRVNC